MHSVYALAIHRICGSYRYTAMPLNVVFSHFGNKQRDKYVRDYNFETQTFIN